MCSFVRCKGPTYHSRPVSANAKSTAFYSRAQNEGGAGGKGKRSDWSHLKIHCAQPRASAVPWLGLPQSVWLTEGTGAAMSHRRIVFLAIALIAAFLLPSSAPAADTFTIILGDSTEVNTRINVSHKGSPGFAPDVYLQPCSSSVTTDCIQSVLYQRKSSSDWITLVPDDKIVFPAAGVPRFGTSASIVVETATTYPADIPKNFPAGGMTRLYKDSKAVNDDGIRYLVQARATGSVNAEGRATWNNLRFDIKAVTVPDYIKLNIFGFPSVRTLLDFENVAQFKVELRTKATRNLFNGWFYGRILQPEIKYTSIGEDESVVQITGSPIAIQVAQGEVTFSDYAAIQASNASVLRSFPNGVSMVFLGATDGFANGQGAMTSWRLLSPLMRERAAPSASAFSLSTTKNPALLTDYYPQGCQASQSLDGVVSTNATMYNPAPPSYDAKDGSLNFEVGSPHLDSTGKVLQGFYSMVVSAKIANCIWGSDLTNSKATVSIINDSGTAQVSTSVLKFANDFYYFHISGFTYSTKKISIRLVPAPAATPTPSATATATTPKAIPAVKKITCVKGKLKKVVSGVKPVCPKGYKIK
jgi:hypothetical protein